MCNIYCQGDTHIFLDYTNSWRAIQERVGHDVLIVDAEMLEEHDLGETPLGHCTGVQKAKEAPPAPSQFASHGYTIPVLVAIQIFPKDSNVQRPL